MPAVAETTSRPAAALGRLRRPLPGVALLLAVLVVALAFGSGLGSGGRPSPAARVAAIDSQVRCPSCEDLSVAQSQASSAVAVRHQVAHLVAVGRTDQEVESALVAEYGPTILLRPPTSGLSSVVWILPAVGGAAAVAALAALFWRRSRQLRILRRGTPT